MRNKLVIHAVAVYTVALLVLGLTVEGWFLLPYFLSGIIFCRLTFPKHEIDPVIGDIVLGIGWVFIPVMSAIVSWEPSHRGMSLHQIVLRHVQRKRSLRFDSD